MEEKKNNSSYIGQKDINTFSIKDISFFKDNPFYLYLYKKNQKLSSAIYMLTELLEDREPIKWSLRSLSLRLTSDSMELNRSELSQSVINKSQIIFSLVSTLLELESLFEIAYSQRLVSEMNFIVLKKELDHLIQLVHEKQQPSSIKTNFILSEDMLKTDEEKQFPGKTYEKLLLSSVQSAPPQSSTVPAVFFKGQKKDMSLMFSGPISSKENNSFLKQPISPALSTFSAEAAIAENLEKKNERREAIISLLQGGKQLMIKDFTEQIKDCSEKTIQRELLLLVSTGFLKKIGERRWSRYTLA